MTKRMIFYETDRDYELAHIKSKRNVSGVIGVSMASTSDGKNVWYSYVAKYTIDRVNYKRSFSVNRFGECGSFRKACAIRYKNAGTLVITDRKAIPCLPEQEYTIK